MARMYKYFTPSGEVKEVKFKDLPPLAKVFHRGEEKKRLAKFRKARREREQRALTLRASK